MTETDDKQPNVEELLQQVNAISHSDYKLSKQYSGGWQGSAYEVMNSEGQPAVFKWTTNTAWVNQLKRAEPIVDKAIAAGIPTPKFLNIGTLPNGITYHLQEQVVGEPMKELDQQNLELIFGLIDKQKDMNLDTTQNWSEYVYNVIFNGESGWTEQIEKYSPETKALLEKLMKNTEKARDTHLPTNDLVHGDLNLGNVMVKDGKVTGYIDFASAGKGHRVIDLASLYAWSFNKVPAEISNQIKDKMLSISTPNEFLIATSSSILALTSFCIDRHGDEGVKKAVTAGNDILDEIMHLQ